MTHIVDKRFDKKNESIENRQKFIKRYKNSIKKALRGSLSGDSIKDFKFKDRKLKVKVKNSDDSLDIPSPRNNPEVGEYDFLHVGNQKYKKGHRIPIDNSGRDSGREGSPDEGGNDEFEFTLTEKEFADLFFEDLELPDMIKRKFTGDSFEVQRCGYSNTGGPSSLNVRQTIIRAFIRKHALRKLRDKKLLNQCDGCQIQAPLKNGIHTVPYPSGNIGCTKDRYSSEANKKKIHFLEDVDLRYNYRDRVDIPSTKAVMFCLMDVSGSMGEREKDIAKRFFILLSMFLKRNYSKVDIVFVRHAEWAEECDEQTFFHGRESGGTIISTGYAKVRDIIDERYNPENWNIYIAQASDGDNWANDNFLVKEILSKYLLTVAQYFSYIEIGAESRRGSNILDLLIDLAKSFNNLQPRIVRDYNEIFDTFRSLFKKDKIK